MFVFHRRQGASLRSAPASRLTALTEALAHARPGWPRRRHKLSAVGANHARHVARSLLILHVVTCKRSVNRYEHGAGKQDAALSRPHRWMSCAGRVPGPDRLLFDDACPTAVTPIPDGERLSTYGCVRRFNQSQIVHETVHGRWAVYKPCKKTLADLRYIRCELHASLSRRLLNRTCRKDST